MRGVDGRTRGVSGEMWEQEASGCGGEHVIQKLEIGLKLKSMCEYFFLRNLPETNQSDGLVGPCGSVFRSMW